MNNSSGRLNYPKHMISKQRSKTHLTGSNCTQWFSSHLWRTGGCFPADTIQQSLIQQEIKCHGAKHQHFGSAVLQWQVAHLCLFSRATGCVGTILIIQTQP